MKLREGTLKVDICELRLLNFSFYERTLRTSSLYGHGINQVRSPEKDDFPTSELMAFVHCQAQALALRQLPRTHSP